MNKPYIGIPIGDPSGIGPEIVLKANLNPSIYEYSNPVAIGSAKIMQQIASILGTHIIIRKIVSPSEGKYSPGTLNIIDVDNIHPEVHEFGVISAVSGKAAYEYICKAVYLANNKEIDAIATTPINKEAIRAASIDFIGHTEMLAAMTGTDDPLTMFQVNELRVFFLSRHLPLKAALELVKKDKIIAYIKKCDQALSMLGLEKKRIAIAGLNPHCGEHGLFGSEETEEIEPAVDELRSEGLSVYGPIPADSVFFMAMRGKFDAVLSLYHDQGHIATKTVDFERTISLTLGMPFLRTSVDHGTAFDIAGKGIASPVSMAEAIKLAALYSVPYRVAHQK